jgi:hypothetical protein
MTPIMLNRNGFNNIYNPQQAACLSCYDSNHKKRAYCTSFYVLTTGLVTIHNGLKYVPIEIRELFDNLERKTVHLMLLTDLQIATPILYSLDE